MNSAVASRPFAQSKTNPVDVKEESLSNNKLTHHSFSAPTAHLSDEMIVLINKAASLAENYLGNRKKTATEQSGVDILPLEDEQSATDILSLKEMRLSVNITTPKEYFASITLLYYREGNQQPAVVVAVERNTGPWEIRAIITEKNLATNLYLKIRL
jgi:hypothetical protein